jgi:hypothetical protein
MTTTTLTTNRGQPIAGSPFDFGAGHINVAAALDPGLVYDIADPVTEYGQYVCGTLPPPVVYAAYRCAVVCRAKGACAKHNLNLPSVSLPAMRAGAPGVAVQRRVTYVGAPAAATFTAQLQLPKGYKGVLSATRLAMSKKAGVGATRGFTLTVTAGADAPLGWSFGGLLWTSSAGKNKYAVRTVIALNRVA